MKLLTQISLASLIIIKIVLGSIFIYWGEVDPLFLERNAVASEVQKDPEGIVNEDETIANEEEIDLVFLLRKRDELKKEEEELARKRAELMAILEEMNNKIAILTQLRDEIRAEMDRKKTVQEKKLKHLKKIYSSMKPQKAASLIEKLDMRFAVELLASMKGDVVGNILSFMDIKKAVRISERLAKRK